MPRQGGEVNVEGERSGEGTPNAQSATTKVSKVIIEIYSDGLFPRYYLFLRLSEVLVESGVDKGQSLGMNEIEKQNEPHPFSSGRELAHFFAAKGLPLGRGIQDVWRGVHFMLLLGEVNVIAIGIIVRYVETAPSPGS